MVHLVEHDHRRIAFIAGTRREGGDSAYRLGAYHAAIREYGLAAGHDLVAHGFHIGEGGQQAAQRIAAACPWACARRIPTPPKSESRIHKSCGRWRRSSPARYIISNYYSACSVRVCNPASCVGS